MKRSVLTLVMVGLFAFSYCPVLAGLSVVSVDGQIGTDTIMYGAPITINILWDGSEFPGSVVSGVSNAYVLYSPTATPFSFDSAEWNPEIEWKALYLDGGVFWDVILGSGRDTVNFGGFRLFGPGIPDSIYEVAHMIHLDPFPQSAAGGEICIDSVMTSGCCPWLWAMGDGASMIPSWSGPHCYTIANCCVGIRGDANVDGSLDIADLAFLINYLFRQGPAPLCHAEADVNVSGGVYITDLTYLCDYLFRGGLAPSACPEE